MVWGQEGVRRDAEKEEELTFTQYLLWPGVELPRPGISHSKPVRYVSPSPRDHC